MPLSTQPRLQYYRADHIYRTKVQECWSDADIRLHLRINGISQNIIDSVCAILPYNFAYDSPIAWILREVANRDISYSEAKILYRQLDQ